MVNLSNYKIIRYSYDFPSEMFESVLWDKMSEAERKWAMRITLDGINDTGGDNDESWDIVLLEPKLEKKIFDVLKKYDVEYKTENVTDKLIDDIDFFSEQFLSKLNSFLKNELYIDGVLDRIIEMGIDNITSFEKYYLNKNKEWENLDN